MSDKKSFNPNKLIEAREFRKVQKTILSKVAGISSQSLVAYEKNKTIPSAEIVQKLAEALNFPYNFFFQKSHDIEGSRIFFRSFATTTKSERISQKWRIEWFNLITEFLSEYFELSEVNIPEELFFKGDFKDLTNDEIELASFNLRKHWGVGQQPIEDFIGLLENNGVFVTKGHSESTKIDAYSRVDENLKNPLIFLCSNKNNYYRTRFDAAHELGHIILHSSIKKSDLTSENLKIIEDQAHLFAGGFLAPAQAFGKNFFYPSLDEFLRLKKLWNMSIGALIMRAANLEFISEDSKSKLFMNYSRRGWRSKGEPLDNIMEPEEPKLLSLCFSTLLKENILTVEEIMNRLNLPIEEVTNLINFDLVNYRAQKDPYALRIKQKNKKGVQIYNIDSNR